MAKPTIAIVGLGLIGTSVGLALKKAGGEFEILGHDREAAATNQAKKLKAVDRTSWNLINSTEEADLVILAIPVSAVEGTLKAMGPYLKKDCLVIDTCAVKRPVLQWADEYLPATVNFVGGDPIVQMPPDSANKKGAEAASETLFQNSIFCLCPSVRATPESVRLASDLVSTLGAKPYFLDPAEHDGLVAGIEHLPLLVSAALLRTVTQSPAWREMRKVAGDTFLAATDMAEGTPAALRGIFMSNSDNLVRWINDLVEQLQAFRSEITASEDADAGENLEKTLDTVIDSRYLWIADRAKGFAGEDLPARTEVPSYWKTMFGMGGGLMRRGDRDKEKEKDDKRKRR